MLCCSSSNRDCQSTSKVPNDRTVNRNLLFSRGNFVFFATLGSETSEDSKKLRPMAGLRSEN